MLTYSADGKWLATGSRDPYVRIWDAATGKEQRRFEGHTNQVTAVAFAPDGKTLASGAKDNTVRLWDVATGKEQLTLEDLPSQSYNHVSGLVFSPDGKTLAASGGEDWVGLWQVDGGKRLRLFAEPHAQDLIYNDWTDLLTFTDEGKTLVVGGRFVRAWDVASGKKLRQWPTFDYGGRIALAKDGTLAVKGYGVRIQLWDLAAGKKLPFLKGVESGGCLAFAPDGKVLAEGGSGGLSFWDARAGKVVRRLEFEDTVACLAFSPDGKTLAGGTDHLVRLWDVASGKEITPAPTEPIFAVTALAPAPHGGAIAVAWQESVYLRDAAGKLHSFAKEDDRVSALAYSPDEKCLAVGLDTGTITLRDRATGKELRQIIEPDARVAGLVFSTDGKSVIALCDDSTLRTYEVATGRELRRIEDENIQNSLNNSNTLSPPLAATPDGKWVAIGSVAQGGVRLLDGPTGKLLHQLKREKAEDANEVGISAVAFSSDGTLLAVVSQDRHLGLWDVAEGKLVRGWTTVPEKKEEKSNDLFAGATITLAFSADGKTLATWLVDRAMRSAVYNDNATNLDDTVVLWETATGKERARFKGHRSGGVLCAGFTTDGRSLVTGGEDTTLLVWNLARSERGRKLAPADLESLWADLAREDAAKAYQAIGTLATAAETPAFLQEKLKPVAAPDGKRVQQLIADLDSKVFIRRNAATEELQKLGEQAEGALRTALKDDPSPEVRQRLEQLVAQLDKARHALSSDQLRIARALEALERSGTAEARQTLTRLSSGVAEAWQTREARGALDRLGPAPRE